MSGFKSAPVSGGPPRHNVLAPLRVAQIVSSKPLLPAGMFGGLQGVNKAELL